MSHTLVETKRLALAAAFVAALVPAAGQARECLPTCADNDAKMLAIAGTGLQTLAGDRLAVRFAVPVSEPSLELEVFDGEVGGRWDAGSQLQIEYKLYTDPNDDGVGDVLVGTWTSGSMSDNAWFPIDVPTGGNSLYLLSVENTTPLLLGRNSFKLAIDNGSISLKPQAFSFIGALSSVADRSTVYPAYPTLTPTTYDAIWEFRIAVPPNAASVTLWDGDLDFGSYDRSANDTDDPDTPAALPPWAVGTAAVSEGVAVGAEVPAPGSGLFATGDPPDDFSGALFRRSPNIRYDLIDPNGVFYPNDNPSGNREWEQFRISKNPADPLGYDHLAADIPAGVWTVRVEGVDLSNLNAWRFETELLGLAPLGDRVWVDTNADGVQDLGEPGLNGVTVNLYDCSDTFLRTTTTANKGSEPGYYLFEGLVVGECYVVEFILPAGYNFTQLSPPGSGLPATDSDADPSGLFRPMGTTPPIVLAGDPTDLGWDAGLVRIPDPPVASLGDLVWKDTNRDGIQDDGEPGIPNVTVKLWECGADGVAGTGDDINTGQSMVTGANGDYLFAGLTPGCYFVEFVEPVGYDFTARYQGADPTVDSNAGQITGRSEGVTLVGGESNLTIDAGLVTELCIPETFVFSGNSNTSGTAGNSVTVSGSGGSVDVRASAWSQSGATYSPAYLGSYGGGLGVTDSSEGTGGNNKHTLDNNGQKNYILLEFSSQVVIDKAYLGYVYSDSDISVWIGTSDDAFYSGAPLTLNAALLGSLGGPETNTGGSSARWADINAGLVSGNVIVIAARTTDANDYVKLNKLLTLCPNQCVDGEISFTGSSSTSGTAGNIRTFNFSTIGLTAKASAWSRTKGTSGTWAKAFLGAYSSGLGVTDTSESGSNDTHTVDNMGRDNYVLVQFSTPILVDRAYLDYVGADSDIQVWVGTADYSTNQTLSDSFLNGLPLKEVSDTSSADSRWADVNASGVVGNVFVLAASTLDTSPEDSFKFRKLDICK